MAGILIAGLNGCGKTTLGRALAERLGWQRLDVEGYYFPDMTVPYANARPEDEVRSLMLEDIRTGGDFVLSSVHCDLGDAIRSRISLAVWLRAPTALRMARIERRELERFGARVLPGGDMYERQRRFRAFAEGRDESVVSRSLGVLDCPLLMLDASLPIGENVEAILRQVQDRGLDRTSSERKTSP